MASPRARAPRGLTQFVTSELAAVADEAKAPAMASYMKTTMPFHGVQKPARVPIFREMVRRFAPADRAAYEAAVRALWKLPHREERYAALEYAARFKPFIGFESLPLYEHLIRTGLWWDLVDDTVGRCVSPLFLKERERLRATFDAWIDDECLWIRRAAILAQLKHKGATDPEQLFAYCLRRASEKEFFVRKAIGWALREYAKVEPDAVRDFVKRHSHELSGLSRREATKHL